MIHLHQKFLLHLIPQFDLIYDFIAKHFKSFMKDEFVKEFLISTVIWKIIDSSRSCIPLMDMLLNCAVQCKRH